MPLFRSSSLNTRFAHFVVAVVFLLTSLWVTLNAFDVPSKVNIPFLKPAKPHSAPPPYVAPTGAHPIDDLIVGANTKYLALLDQETVTLHDAAEHYRQRRGRQPPPGFDVWFSFAKNNSALIVEELFDPIYDDLNPFWGVPAKIIREQANDFAHKIYVRDGKTDWRSDMDRPWMNLWGGLVKSIEQYVPDVDMPINVMDESRLVVPWEEIDSYMTIEKKTRKIVPASLLKSTFQSLRALDENPPPPFDPMFATSGEYWSFAAMGCDPHSPGRNAPLDTDWTKPPPLPTRQPKGSYKGYVMNWTHVKQPCEFPELRGLHGSFVEPISLSISKRLFPLFGGSKLPMNNEILLPPAMYWTNDPFYSGGNNHGGKWEDKKTAMVWRGAASGGRNRRSNWKRFQRHRFLSMVNGTSVHLAEDGKFPPPNFVLPERLQYYLSAWDRSSLDLGDWVRTWSDAAFVHLLCFPYNPDAVDPKECNYTNPYYKVEQTIDMKHQYGYKYLPDIDGNSFSGRYRGFLGSTSVPIKATIYNEWHDSRLIPWKHFVPMDNTFVDIYGIMDYFIGNPRGHARGHDDQAKQIALTGKAWAETVLRREDMQIYVLRLLLEYARVCDDDREVMGWAESDAG